MATRRENWSKGERGALIRSYYSESRAAIVEGKLSSTCTNADKNAAWDDIINEVNASSKCQRTAEGIKKKISDLKSLTKKRERRNRAYRKQTGGGPPPEPLEDWEEEIISHMPDSVIEGIKDGVDTFQGSINRNKKCTRELPTTCRSTMTSSAIAIDSTSKLPTTCRSTMTSTSSSKPIPSTSPSKLPTIPTTCRSTMTSSTIAIDSTSKLPTRSTITVSKPSPSAASSSVIDSADDNDDNGNAATVPMATDNKRLKSSCKKRKTTQGDAVSCHNFV